MKVKQVNNNNVEEAKKSKSKVHPTQLLNLTKPPTQYILLTKLNRGIIQFRKRQLDTSPTQGWGKVGARLGQGLGQGWGKVGARFGQGLDKKQGSGKIWAGKVWARFGQEIVTMGLISDRGRR